jgi:hypothetical protein
MALPRFPIYGYLAEFHSGEGLLEAARRTKAAGYEVVEAYTPVPMEEVSHALGHRATLLPWVVLGGGVLGALVGFGMQYWVSVEAYPLNVGGRPLNSWPAFLVVTFEMTILFAALSAVLGMFALNGLPRPYHPVFHVPMFETASRNRFFLMILSRDARFDMLGTRAFLESLAPLRVEEVPH